MCARWYPVPVMALNMLRESAVSAYALLRLGVESGASVYTLIVLTPKIFTMRCA